MKIYNIIKRIISAPIEAIALVLFVILVGTAVVSSITPTVLSKIIDALFYIVNYLCSPTVPTTEPPKSEQEQGKKYEYIA